MTQWHRQTPRLRADGAQRLDERVMHVRAAARTDAFDVSAGRAHRLGQRGSPHDIADLRRELKADFQKVRIVTK